MKLQKIIDVLEELYPAYLRVGTDPVGLQVGSRNQEVTRVMTTLDVDSTVVQEAIERKVDCIISYHSLLFAGIHRVDLDAPKGRVVATLIEHGISVYSLHSRLDTASDGLAQWMGEAIGLQDMKPLVPTITQDGTVFGYGRVGKLPSMLTLDALIPKVKAAFALESVTFVGDANKPIQTVAIMGGSAEEFYLEAMKAGGDIFLTGDVRFHTAQDSQHVGMNMLDIGHYAEHIVAARLQNVLAPLLDVPVIESAVNTNPFEIM